MESTWHRDAMFLLISLFRFIFRGRADVFVGGNMFIHFNERGVRNLDFRGPDAFVVKGVDGTRYRRYWAVWQEDGRYPDVIFELVSPTTALADRTVKKDTYERIFHTSEYFLYDPETETLEGWRLDANQRYQQIKADKRGWLWSEQLVAWVGKWRGQFEEGLEAVYPRCFTKTGKLIPLFAEHACSGREAEGTGQKGEGTCRTRKGARRRSRGRIGSA